MNNLKNFSRSLISLLRDEPRAELPAFLGNLSGTVPADQMGNVYVTLVNGEVLTVYNGRVPNQSRLPVVVGYGDGTKLQVLRSRDVYVTPPYPDVPGHAFLHTFPNPDTVPVRGEQFVPGLVVPAGSLIVKVYGLAYELSDGWHILPTQEIDLTSNVPADGAIFALLEADNTGAITVNEGSAVASRAMLEYSDIPAATADHYPIAAVKLYSGQTSILQTVIDSDIIDLRWGRAGGGGGGGTPGGSDTQVQYNNGGAFGGDAEFTWDDVTKALGIGDPSLLPAISPDHTFWMVGDGVSPSQFMVSYGSSFAPFTTFMKADGSVASPANVKDDQVIGHIRGRGYDGTGWTNTRIEIRFVADGDWAVGDTPTRIELWTCPDGSGTLTLAMTIGSDGNVNIATGKEYRVNGSQHAHSNYDVKLTNTNISPTTANVSAAAGNRYFADISGLTANRNFVLPTPAIGDVIELNLTVGDTQYALIIIGDTGVKINKGTAATEWSRLFIANESIRLVADATDNWQVVTDGRIPCTARIKNTGSQNISHNTVTTVVLDEADFDNASLGDTTNYRLTARRANKYIITGFLMYDNIAAATRAVGTIQINGGTYITQDERSASAGSSFPTAAPLIIESLAVGDYLNLIAYHNSGATEPTYVTGFFTHLEFTEIL